jgi:hypothetical protein
MRRVLRAAAVAAALLYVCGCASVPPTRERPQAGCEFDVRQRFTYVLIVQRDSFATVWVPRTPFTVWRDPNDQEERVVPTRTVRPGFCPDEMQTPGGGWPREPEGRLRP